VADETLKARPCPSFLWFTRGGKAYLVTDAAALEQAAGARSPLEGTLGEQLRHLADELLESGAAEQLADT
jgi:hypothetical protein